MNKLSQGIFNERKEMFLNGFGYCTKCRKYKPLDNFAKNRSAEFGHYSWCRECHSKKRKRNPDTMHKAREYARSRKAFFAEKLGGRCAICGYDRTYHALDFHHINRDEKKFNINNILRNSDEATILSELDKCILLCANCHREYEGGAIKVEFDKCDGLGYKVREWSFTEKRDQCPHQVLFQQTML